MKVRSPTKGENRESLLPSSIRHSRACGNPGLFSALLAWIPAFAGMTELGNLVVPQIISGRVFSTERFWILYRQAYRLR